MATIYILEFLIFSFIGWFIDSAYRSIYDKKLVSAGYLRGPICPIYGFGGLVLVFVLKYLNFLSLVPLLLLASLAMILVEYIGGIFSEKALKVRLWDYSKTTFHLGGHIDLLHSFYWLVLVILFNFFAFPYVLVFERVVVFPEFVKLPSLLLFMLVSLWITVRKNPEQFLRLKGKVLDLSVRDYRKLFADFRKMSKARTLQAREMLLNKIRKELEGAGARLKKVKF